MTSTTLAAPLRFTRRRLPGLLLVACLPLVSCGGGGGSPSAPTPTAVVALALAPQPLVTHPCDDCGDRLGELEFEAAATLRESAGVGAQVTAFLVSLRSDAGVQVLQPGDYAFTAGLPAGGQVTLPFALHFPGGTGNVNVPATVTLEVRLRDDHGHTLTVSTTAPVLPPA